MEGRKLIVEKHSTDSVMLMKDNPIGGRTYLYLSNEETEKLVKDLVDVLPKNLYGYDGDLDDYI